MFNNYNSLGFNNPYYLKQEDKLIFQPSFKDILKEYEGKLKIDMNSVSQILSLNHMLGDRTIVESISKSPWLAKVNLSQTGFDFYKLAKHNEIQKNQEEIARDLYSFLRKEVKGYIGSFKKIGILLSGGMDSRMVAGVLKDLIIDQEVFIDSVTCYTWGESESRDVVYAKLVCDKLGWNFKHYTVSSEDLWHNFEIAASNGCEYSGLHLHAIPQIENDLDVEVLLAGSFGDSIGRAEYSGKNVLSLIPFNKRSKNFGYLLSNDVYCKTKIRWQSDLSKYHKIFPEDKVYQQLELDYQSHYMRRMLNPCIGVLAKKCQVFQVFSSPIVYEYMWSLHPKSRTDDVYLHLLKLFKTDIRDIPWARTGLPYGTVNGVPDSYKKSHHKYSYQIQNKLLDKIEIEITSGFIFNYIDKRAALRILKLIKKYPNNNFDYLERIAWLTSFSMFLRQNNLNVLHGDSKSSSNFLNSDIKLTLEYLIKRSFREFKNIV